MKWRLLVEYLFLIMFLTSLFTISGGAQDSCTEADALRDIKLYEEAQTAYIDLLKNNSQLECALTGIKELNHAKAIELFELGQAYENARQMDAARNSYIDSLKIDPNFTKSQDALARISGNFTVVYTLASMGFNTEASEKLKKIVAENPSIDVPEDLKFLSREKISLWWLLYQFESFIVPIGKLIVIIISNILTTLAFLREKIQNHSGY